MKHKIRDYIDTLNAATAAYDDGEPYMSDMAWDELYYELERMEKESGIIYPDSPTQSIHFEMVRTLPKVKHEVPMLSLGKTKDAAEAETFKRKYSCIVMSKMDGLTLALTYENGELMRAETRGNGEEGEDVTHNAKVVKSIPRFIPEKSKVIVHGEIICTYQDFAAFAKIYKNPRNFASGSIRLQDAQECAKRNLTFVAWDCINHFDNYMEATLHNKLEELDNWGFITAPWCCPSADDSFESCIDFLKEQSANYPIDGLVMKIDNCADYEREGRTAHHPIGALAFKFYDETYPSTLLDIEWTMGRTGVLTPVAVFEPVEINGAIIERANLHNISVMRELLGDYPHVRQVINVYRANMIIPQLIDCEMVNEGDQLCYLPGRALHKPDVCPVCNGGTATIKSDSGTLNLICTNSQCQGKLINVLDHFAGKKGLDIKGLSKATLEKLIDWGWLETISDIYTLHEHKEEWVRKVGFGAKSVDNILNAIEASKNCELAAFISALGIPLIGSTYAKQLCKFEKTYEDFRRDVDNRFDFTSWSGFGDEMCRALWNYDYAEADKLKDILNIHNSMLLGVETSNASSTGTLTGKSIVITGRLTLFKNRAELQAAIEAAGGKVTSSISKNTAMLINNDIESTSSKNAAAKRLGIPIITEKEFKENYLN